MPPQPTCLCGACRKCKNRARKRAVYDRMTREERRALVARRNRDKILRYERERYPQRRDDPNEQRKQRAREQLKYAVKRGLIVRQPCEQHGPECSPTVQAHHDDYSRPYDVRWLCTYHHAQEHR